MTDLTQLSAAELLDGYRGRAFAPSEVLEALAERIEAADPRINAFVTLSLEPARAAARAADAAWRAPDTARPLEGIPIGVKDLFDTAGIRTTYGSSMYAEHVPDADAAVVARARAAGAIVVGKTATHEFGWGITTNNPHFGPTRNPWAPDRVPGGSSGGSAAALAAGMVPLAIGSDTGGSIRIPAAFCGVSGLKPTWGRISAAGAVALAPTLDHAGVMAREPGDLALLYGVLAGVDPADPATEDVPVTLPRGAALEGLRVGIARAAASAPLGPGAERALAQAAAAAADAGARVVDVELPDPAASLATFVTTQRAEAANAHRVLGLYPARAAEYGADVRGRLKVADGVTLAEYLAAGAERRRLRAAFARVLSAVDVIVSPVSAVAPPPIGAETVEHLGAERDVRELVMTYTVPQDLFGVPACAIPAGRDGDDLPVGLQVTGRPWAEAAVLDAACALAQALAVERRQYSV